MEKEKVKVYQDLMEFSSRQEESKVTDQDLIQSAIVRALETGKKFNDDNHFKAYLKSAIRSKRIDTEQQKENLVSLSDTDIGNEIETFAVSIPKDYYLYKWIITQKTSKGRYLFSSRERKVFAKRYLGGKTQEEISEEMGIDRTVITKNCQAIQRKLLSLPIKDMAGAWYYGSGVYSSGDIWAEIEVKPSRIGFLKRYRRAGKQTDLEKFRKDSARCFNQHSAIVGVSATPIYNDTPIPQGKPERDPDHIPDYYPVKGKSRDLTPIVKESESIKRNSLASHFKHNVDNHTDCQPWLSLSNYS